MIEVARGSLRLVESTLLGRGLQSRELWWWRFWTLARAVRKLAWLISDDGMVNGCELNDNFSLMKYV